MDLEEIISGCKKQQRKSQKILYEMYSPELFRICLRYMKNREDAEDALIEGMYKILTKINMYKGEGSFEGWVKRIIVNECLMKLRKNNPYVLTLESSQIEISNYVTIEDELAYENLLDLLRFLPDGYRTVFNLYVIEGFKHKEIADLLGISINTSKSQLILARKRLQSLIKKKHNRIAN